MTGRRLSVVFCLLFLAVHSGLLFAQSGTTSVLGQVTDQQGAAIVGATITVKHLGTGVERTGTTDATGTYHLTSLPPGTYNIRAEMQGFRTATNDNVGLLVNTASRVNFTMLVGAQNEVVEVTAHGEVLNTTDASLGNAFSELQIRQLPLEGRNVVGLLSLQAGAVFVPVSATSYDNRQGSVSGSRGDQTNVTLDGVDVNDPNGYAYSSALRTTLDSTQEFRVTTTNYGADQGRSSAAQVTLVTKSGTNALHGGVYAYHRNTAWSSNEYFNKASQLWNAANGIPDNNKNKPPKLLKTIWGLSLGGPIKKDRLFAFFNMENLRQKSEAAVERQIPSASFRDGILIYGCATASACPATSVKGISGKSYSVQAGYHGLTPIELAAIDPLGIGPSLAASKYYQQYPMPNSGGRDGINFAGYRFAAPNKTDQYTYISRWDYKLDGAGKHTLTWRGNLQDDHYGAQPQFPGQKSRYFDVGNNRGMMLGYTGVLTPHLVNSFRYGYTRIGGGTSGPLKGPSATFRFFDAFDSQYRSSSRMVPTHNFVDDLTWNRGTHTLQAGLNFRFVSVITSNEAGTWPTAVANGSWVQENGKAFAPGTSCPAPSTDACLALPLVSDGSISSFADGWVDILGIMSQSNVTYNYDKTGKALPFGQALKRHYATHAYEMYWQDNWRIRPNLNIVYGFRYSLNSPPWETNGEQVGPTVDMGKWFDQRKADMLAGIPSNKTPLISFDLIGAANGKKPMYPYDKNNVSPRVAFSYSPNFDTGFMRTLTGGPGRMAIRGGYGIAYDNMGLALANRIDRVASFGMSTSFSSPYQAFNEDYAGIRFVNTSTVPHTYAPAPPGGFPYTPPTEMGAIEEGVDNSLTTPYSHQWNFMIGRELPANMTFEMGYVGRRGRNLTVRRDLAMPFNIKDTKSGMDYYTAARLLIEATKGIPATASRSAYTGIAPIAFFQNLFPGLAGTYSGTAMTATQYLARALNRSGGDWTTAMYNIDEYGSPAYSSLGPFALYNQQWDALGALSTLAKSEYHGLQANLRKRYSNGLDFTLNYTFSKSSDTGSAVERGSFWTDYGTGGYTGILINSWDPNSTWSPSDFDVRHQINVNWTADLPFGRQKRFGGSVNHFVDALIGGWQWNGIWRWSTGFPMDIVNCRSCWATNWQVQGNAQPKTPGVYPATGHYQFVVGDPKNGPLLPSMFKNPTAAYNDYFRLDYPGEGGMRNYVRGDGYFTVDTGIGKSFKMPYKESHLLKFRWEIFNLTNSARFDVANVNATPGYASNFGSYAGVLSGCDNAAGRCMQASLRYEF